MKDSELKKFTDYSFEYALSTKEIWFISGTRLLQSAEVLLEQLWDYKKKSEEIRKTKREFDPSDPDWATMERSTMEPAITMLLGYAIENYIKGLWVTQNPEKVKGSKHIPKELKKNSGHDLIHLFGICGIKLSKKEEKALEILSEFTRWRGRYAIDLTADKYYEHWKKQNNGFFVSSKYPKKAEWPDEIIALINKISDKIENK